MADNIYLGLIHKSNERNWEHTREWKRKMFSFFAKLICLEDERRYESFYDVAAAVVVCSRWKMAG